MLGDVFVLIQYSCNSVGDEADAEPPERNEERARETPRERETRERRRERCRQREMPTERESSSTHLESDAKEREKKKRAMATELLEVVRRYILQRARNGCRGGARNLHEHAIRCAPVGRAPHV